MSEADTIEGVLRSDVTSLSPACAPEVSEYQRKPSLPSLRTHSHCLPRPSAAPAARPQALWDVLPYEEFSLRVPRSELHRIVDILDDVTPQQLEQLQVRPRGARGIVTRVRKARWKASPIAGGGD